MARRRITRSRRQGNKATKARPFQIRVTGADELLGGLELMEERALDPFGRGVKGRLYQELLAEIGANFKGARVLGKRWAPLKPGYQAYKAVHAPGRPILVFSGRMRASLTQPDHPQNKIIASRPSQLKFRFSNRLIKYHQLGTKNMEARPVFLANKALAKRMAQHVFDGLTGVRLASVPPLFRE